MGPDAPLPLRNQQANYKGSSNKWALCGVSKTHREGKKVLFIFPPPILPPFTAQFQPSTKTVSGRLCCQQSMGFLGGKEKTRLQGGKTRRDAPMGHACHHTCSPCLCYMMPDVLRCCATSAMMLKKTHVRTHLPVYVIHSCCHSQLCEPREQDFPTRHRELIPCDACGCAKKFSLWQNRHKTSKILKTIFKVYSKISQPGWN